VAAPRAYHLVCPRWTENRVAVQAFRNWLMAEVARFDKSRLLTRARGKRRR
jgi:hypothetical protein